MHQRAQGAAAAPVLAACLALCLSLCWALLAAGPAQAQLQAKPTRPTLSYAVTPGQATPGQSVLVTVTVKNGHVGQRVQVQRFTAKHWTRLTSAKVVRHRKKLLARLRFAPAQALGYRLYLPRTRSTQAVVHSLRLSMRSSLAGRTPLRFGLQGAVGLALRSSTVSGSRSSGSRSLAATTGSNLDVVTDSGVTRDAVTSGAAAVSKFYVAPNGRLFVVFNIPVDLDDTSVAYGNQRCLFASVDRTTGVPSCVDSSLYLVDWGTSPVQFDAAGAMYYSGYANTAGQNGHYVLRRADGRGITDLVNDNVQVERWRVLPDGAVLLTGYTQSTGSFWTRLIRPDGSLTTLYPGRVWGNPLADGNFYFSDIALCSGYTAMRRFDTTTLQLDSIPWARPTQAPCTGGTSSDLLDQILSGIFATAPDGRTVSYQGVTAGGTTSVRVVRVDPSLPTARGTSTSSPDGSGTITSGDGYFEQTNVFPSGMTLAAATRSSIVFAGNAGANGAEHKLVQFDLNSWMLRTLDVQSDIEFYHLAPVGDDVLFQGLRFSDNKVVEGRIDGATHQVHVLGTTDGRWVDLQGF